MNCSVKRERSDMTIMIMLIISMIMITTRMAMMIIILIKMIIDDDDHHHYHYHHHHHPTSSSSSSIIHLSYYRLELLTMLGSQYGRPWMAGRQRMSQNVTDKIIGGVPLMTIPPTSSWLNVTQRLCNQNQPFNPRYIVYPFQINLPIWVWQGVNHILRKLRRQVWKFEPTVICET